MLRDIIKGCSSQEEHLWRNYSKSLFRWIFYVKKKTKQTSKQTKKNCNSVSMPAAIMIPMGMSERNLICFKIVPSKEEILLSFIRYQRRKWSKFSKALVSKYIFSLSNESHEIHTLKSSFWTLGVFIIFCTCYK